MTLISELVELLGQCPVLPLQVSSNIERSVSSLVVHKLSLLSTTALLRALSPVELEVSALEPTVLQLENEFSISYIVQTYFSIAHTLIVHSLSHCDGNKQAMVSSDDTHLVLVYMTTSRQEQQTKRNANKQQTVIFIGRKMKFVVNQNTVQLMAFVSIMFNVCGRGL